MNAVKFAMPLAWLNTLIKLLLSLILFTHTHIGLFPANVDN